jgi:opacity protein-like surface antigen
MRSMMAAVALAAAFVGAPQAASAQSPYSYAWCAKYYTRGTPTSCYYATYSLCMATVSGIGGYCFLNPGYRGAAASPRRYRYRRH